MATRAIVYENNGDPASALYAVTLPPPGPLSGRSVGVKVLLSSINPSDIHVVHGTYAIQPVPRELDVNGKVKTLYLPGNEGLGEITEVGPDVKILKKGDWVVFSKRQSGTWSSAQVLEEEDVIKVDRGSGISAVNASTLTVSRSIETRPEKADRRFFLSGLGKSRDRSQDAKFFRRFEARRLGCSECGQQRCEHSFKYPVAYVHDLNCNLDVIGRPSSDTVGQGSWDSHH